ncbi:hypothetical protein ACA910_015711 [Epithemia clementina (nom. ined.)]
MLFTIHSLFSAEFNNLIKVFYYRRTQRGGAARKLGKKSRLLPIALWLQRQMVWLGSKKTYEEIRGKVDKYSKEKGQLPQWDDLYDGKSWAMLHQVLVQEETGMLEIGGVSAPNTTSQQSEDVDDDKNYKESKNEWEH